MYALAGRRRFVFQGTSENAQCCGGLPSQSLAVIEVEMTKGTLEPELPGRTEEPGDKLEKKG